MIISFNIKYRPQIESGEYKVRTASGKPARIVCWDMKTALGEPVLALITDEVGREYSCTYREDGLYIGNNENYLIIEDGRPDPRTRWENRVREILENTVSIEKTAEALYDAAQRENYDRMLDAARKGKVVIEGTNGQARDDAPEMKAYYDR